MIGRSHSYATAGALIACLSGEPAPAADFSDPTWPCIQRKQPRLSPAAMWAGPPADESIGRWEDDPGLRRLVPVLAVRRTEMNEAERLIEAFAEGLGENRNARLTLLFTALFERIDRERSEIIAGIGRYAKKQIALSEQIDATRERIAELEAVEDPSFDQQDELEELRDKLGWDTRIFEERASSLTYVCESPVLLEQRIFALARTIMSRLD